MNRKSKTLRFSRFYICRTDAVIDTYESFARIGAYTIYATSSTVMSVIEKIRIEGLSKRIVRVKSNTCGSASMAVVADSDIIVPWVTLMERNSLWGNTRGSDAERIGFEVAIIGNYPAIATFLDFLESRYTKVGTDIDHIDHTSGSDLFGIGTASLGLRVVGDNHKFRAMGSERVIANEGRVNCYGFVDYISLLPACYLNARRAPDWCQTDRKLGSVC